MLNLKLAKKSNVLLTLVMGASILVVVVVVVECLLT